MERHSELISFLIALINEFGKRFSLTDRQAHAYLRRYGTVELIVQHYDIAHTLSFDGNIEMITTYCLRAGGRLAL